MASIMQHVWGALSSLAYYRFIYYRYSLGRSILCCLVIIFTLSLMLAWILLATMVPGDPREALQRYAASDAIDQIFPADLVLLYSSGTFQVNHPTPYVVPLPRGWRAALSSLFEAHDDVHSLNSKAYVLLQHRLWDKLQAQVVNDHGLSVTDGAYHVLENFLVVDQGSESAAGHNVRLGACSENSST
eukprot:TRINITY_DN5812_c0_g1_i1.p1 TRINITY_DN5812_c0_g1~~TRINITY_DN5812_c0_g1_i1.p1  ORF type:complete len:187 (-),score=19.59 TRINITY_DN5812_c0_g1_i1:119-679(-)